MSVRALTILVLMTSWANVVSGSADNTSLKQVAQKALNEYQVAGASIVRVEQGEVVERLSLGQGQPGLNVQTNSIFQVGSISKPVAAWAVMTLVRDGSVNLDASIQNYVSRWSLPQSKYDLSEVTVRRLLSHTAGLRLQGYPGYPEHRSLPSIEESLSGESNGSGDVRLFQAPGKGFSYSGGGYTLLQLMVEEVSGIPFAEYVEKAVLRPLGMVNSSYQPDETLLTHRVVPHGFDRDPIPHHHFRAQAAASLHTSVEDLAKFLIANVSENQVLSSEFLSLMHTGIADAGFAKIGLGFFIFGDGRLIGHGGANQGWRADLVFDRQSGSGLATLTNAENGGRLIDAVRCYWDDRHGPQSLAEACKEKQNNATNSLRLYSTLAGLIGAFLTAIFFWRLSLWHGGKLQFGFSGNSARAAMMFVSLGALVLWLLFFYTPLGAYLVSGFLGMFATINYAPVGFNRFSNMIVALLIVISLSLFTYKKITN